MNVEASDDERKLEHRPHQQQKQSRRVLDEDEYLAGLDAVIRAQFFPTAPPGLVVAPALTVDEYVSRFMDEDSAAFDSIQEREEEARKKRVGWMDAQTHISSRVAHVQGLMAIEDSQRQRLLTKPRSSIGSNAQAQIEYAPYTARNHLMFPPQSHHAINPQGTRVEKSIRTENTRFAVPALPLKRGTSSSGWSVSDVTSDSASSDFHEPQTPTINGYKLVRSPTSRGASDVDSTPSFHVQVERDRERIARQLGDRVSKRLKRLQDTPITASSIASPSSVRSWASSGSGCANQRQSKSLIELSPAAHRLLNRCARHDDIGLRATYGGGLARQLSRKAKPRR